MKINHKIQIMLISAVLCTIVSGCFGSSKAAAEGAFIDYVSVAIHIPDLLQGADTTTKISLNDKNGSIFNDPTGKQYKVEMMAVDGNNNPTNDIIGITPSVVTLTRGTDETKTIEIHGKEVGIGKIIYKVTREDRTVDQKAYTLFKVVAKS